MNIVEAKNETLYNNPRRFIEKEILPLEILCWKCKSKLRLDFVSDFQYDTTDGKSALKMNCMNCKVDGYISKNSSVFNKKTLDVVLHRPTSGWAVLAEHYDDIVGYYKKVAREEREKLNEERAAAAREKNQRRDEQERKVWFRGAVVLIVGLLVLAGLCFLTQSGAPMFFMALLFGGTFMYIDEKLSSIR